MGLIAVNGMLPLPTGAAEVLEALEVPAEVRAHHSVAHGAQGVLQVGVYLHLFREFRSLYLYESCLDGLHEALEVAKRHPSRPNGVLVTIRVDAGVDHAPKQVVHDQRQNICIDEAV